MSEEETQFTAEDGQMLTAEYNDGQLQIVEVAAFDQGRYVQVLDSDKGVMNLDLLSLIKSEGNPTFQLVGTSSGDDDTVTCVLANHNGEIQDNEKQDSYVIVDTEDGRDPLVYLQSTLQQINTQNAYRDDKKKKKPLTPEEIVQKAKMLQRANMVRSRRSGRKRGGDLEPPTEMLSLLASPGFKLYLYSCKLCSFKCNAIKEMSKHKATEHSGKNRAGGVGRSAGANMQCAQCPFRGTGHMQLMKHVKDKHSSEDEDTTELVIQCDDMSEADVLVCGACGFESAQRDEFREHIENAHGVNVTLSPPLIKLSENTLNATNQTDQQSNSKEEYIIS